MAIHITPLVIPLDQSTPITVRGLEPHTAYTVHLRARRQHGPGTEHTQTTDGQGCLVLENTYRERGEVWLDMLGTEPLVRCSFYVLPPELYARRPLRCDFHIHTHYSDGRASPAQMAVRGRELGRAHRSSLIGADDDASNIFLRINIDGTRPRMVQGGRHPRGAWQRP